jgi:hypothetical protein
MAGTGGGGTGGAPPCYTVAFTAPTDGASLTVANDKDMTCANGFQYTVRITTSAPDGTPVQLFNNGNSLLMASTVTSGAATFDVQLSSAGQSALSIQFPSTAMCTDPTTRSTVTVNCPNTPPTCTIMQPTISATHPALNGVLSPAGDRASQPGSPYQVKFTVSTNAEDGQPVSLSFNNTAPPATVTTLSQNASGGSATFAGVPLSPDGTYQVVATCKNAAGVTGTSQLTNFPVDTTAPDLTLTQPADGQFFGPGMLTANQFKVCGRTSSTDAANLPAALGPAVNNLCVALSGSASCVGTAPVTAINTDACVPVTCPGAAPFDINVTLTDAAGNPTQNTIHGVSCASTLPSVQIIRPVSDAPAFGDPSKHILAANAPVGVLDQDPNTPGGQTDVVACTDRNGSARLFVGLSGATLDPAGSSVLTVPAVPADNCPAGYGFVARFPGATLLDSTENASGTIAIPTELRVQVTDALNPLSIGPSTPVDVWVDTVPPVLSVQTPADLCGSFQQSSMTVTQPVVFNAENDKVVAKVANGSMTVTYPSATSFAGGFATFSAVDFLPGQNNLTATETDPAGNLTTLAPAPCTVIIGSAPVVTFTQPTAGQALCPNGSTAAGCDPTTNDADPNTPGWQGTLIVQVTGDGNPITAGNVTFTVGSTTLGTGPVPIDPSGKATLAGVTLNEGTVTIVATTDNIPNRGVGSGSVTVDVDLTSPDAPTGLSAAVLDRRQTSFQLSWTAPADNGANVAGYDVRAARAPITSGNFDDASVTVVVPYTGQPAAFNQPDGVAAKGLFIETDYYFAVRAKDAAGNTSPILATASPTRAPFLTTTLTGVGTDGLGIDLDGSGDFGGAGNTLGSDGYSDLIVGGTGGTHVYVYFGSAGGYSTTPSITFTGSVANFGQAVVDAGDLDGDGLDDIAISSPSDGSGKVFIFSRKNPPLSWGTPATWPTALMDTDATYTLTADPTFAGATNSIFRRAMTRLGNFDGTGSDDLAIGFRLHGSSVGGVVIVKGGTSFGSMTIPDPAAVNTIEIDGTIAGGQMGVSVVGIGPFFPSPGLVIGAPIARAVYAFKGQAPANGMLTTPDDSVIGTASDQYGINLGFLGPVGGSAGAVTVASTMGRYVDVHLGTAATGPLLGPAGGAPAASVRFIDTASGNSFGIVNLGGGVKGTSQAVSFIGGDTATDLVLAGQGEANVPIYIVSGAGLPSLTGTVDVSVGQTGITSPVVKLPNHLPTPWAGYSGASLIVKSNNDVYPDFAVGESAFGAAGRVVVFY